MAVKLWIAPNAEKCSLKMKTHCLIGWQNYSMEKWMKPTHTLPCFPLPFNLSENIQECYVGDPCIHALSNCTELERIKHLRMVCFCRVSWAETNKKYTLFIYLKLTHLCVCICAWMLSLDSWLLTIYLSVFHFSRAPVEPKLALLCQTNLLFNHRNKNDASSKKEKSVSFHNNGQHHS